MGREKPEPPEAASARPGRERRARARSPRPEAASPSGYTAVLNDHGAERVREGHPWVYAGDILGWEPRTPPEDADCRAGVASPPSAWGWVVRARDRRGRELGQADYSPHSGIRLRMLSRESGPGCDAGFFRQRLARALAYRRPLTGGSDAYRLVSAEADGLPGLIVDRYAHGLVVQTLTWAMAARQTELLGWLDELLGEERPSLVVERNDTRIREREGLALGSGLLRGVDPHVRARINGLQFGLDLLAGQKTGGFLDQRENWAAAAAVAASLGLKTALDVFTYQGGFALHLARQGMQVEAVDSSRPALEAAERNAIANGFPALQWIEANAFDLLRDYDQTGRSFDCVVLDPPAFAKSRAALASAAAGYKEINLRALKLLRPGGLLVSCSCSHHLSETHLLELLAAAAADARRELVLVERRGQALDHPVLLNVPETRYLKCILAIAR